jgi:hypothetical protein
MRKTADITLTLLAAAAMLSLGCDDRPKGQIQRCVDPSGRVADDVNCDQRGPTSYTNAGIYPYYRWYYGGSGFFPGGMATGGSFEPASGVASFRAGSPEGAAIIRGGFGYGFSDSAGA